MKKILITIVGLLLMFTYGCTSDDAKKSAEKTKEVTIEAKDKTVSATKDAANATKDAAANATEKTTTTVKDAAKTTN